MYRCDLFAISSKPLPEVTEIEKKVSKTMKPKFISPQTMVALFGAFVIAVLAFAQYRMSALDAIRRT